jgi:hypothetical protein
LSLRVVLVRLDELELSLLGGWAVDRVAGHAGDVARLVRAPLPEDLLALRVALEADGVLINRSQRRLLAEAEIVGRVRLILQVLAPRTVARLASARLEVTAREVRAQELAVEGTLHLLGLVLVAALALVASDIGCSWDGWGRSVDPNPEDQAHDHEHSDHAQQPPEIPWDPPSRNCRPRNCFRLHVIFLQSMDHPIRQPAFFPAHPL